MKNLLWEKWSSREMSLHVDEFISQHLHGAMPWRHSSYSPNKALLTSCWLSNLRSLSAFSVFFDPDMLYESKGRVLNERKLSRRKSTQEVNDLLLFRGYQTGPITPNPACPPLSQPLFTAVSLWEVFNYRSLFFQSHLLLPSFLPAAHKILLTLSRNVNSC